MSEITNRGSPGQAGSGSPSTSNALPIGYRLHEFEIVRLIGEGGFGIVYLATDHSLQRTVAIKEYMPGSIAARGGDSAIAIRVDDHRSAFEVGLRSFINEARLLAQFDHPALLKVFRFWEQNGTAYIAMPYYQGHTLKHMVRKEPGFVSEARLKSLLIPLVDALAAIHREDCYHRDISPDNILVLGNGIPVLIDFGAARRILTELTQVVTVILKPGYAPVEQYADDAKQGPWTDVYGLSAVMYFAIAGKAPPAAVTRLFTDPLVPLRDLASADFSADFLEGIHRGLEVRPEARPQTMEAFRDLLGLPIYRAPGSSASSRLEAPLATTRPASQPRVTVNQAVPPADARVAAPAISSIDETLVAPMQPTVLAPGSTRAARFRTFAGAAVVALVAIASAWWMLRPPGTPEGAPAAERAVAAPTSPAKVERDITSPPAAPTPPPKRIASATPEPAAKAPAAPPETVPAPPPVDASPPAPIDKPVEQARPVESPPRSTPAPAQAGAPFRLTVPLSVKPWGEVYVDEKRIGMSPPLNALTLSEGKHWVELRHPGFRNHSMLFEVKRGDPEFRIVHEFK